MLKDLVRRSVGLLNNNPQKKKLMRTLELLEKHKLTLVHEIKLSKDSIVLRDDQQVEVGYFTITSHNTFTLMMSINVDERYLKAGFSRLLVSSMVFVLQNKVRKDQLFFIDVDASYNSEGKSFWNHIGMNFCRFDKENRSAIRRTNFDGVGCEKSITFADLSRWAIGVPMGDNQIIVSLIINY